jgi:hypothetical protein
MTLDVLRAVVRGSKSTPSRSPIAIGEVDADVFNCPSCTRPLGVGTNRCPGCGTLLIMGVQAGRASFLVAIGMAFGILAGGLVTAIVLDANRNMAVAAEARSVPTTVEDGAPALGSGPPALAPAAVPPVSAGLSAIRQTAIIDERLLAASSLLSAHLVAPTFETGEVAKLLRSIAADATIGTVLAARVATWTEAGEVGAGLGALYDETIATARDGLRSPLRDAASYRLAAERVVASLAGLSDLDAAARALAAGGGAPVAEEPGS